MFRFLFTFFILICCFFFLASFLFHSPSFFILVHVFIFFLQQDFYYGFEQELTRFDNDKINITLIARLIEESTEGMRVVFTENHDMASNQNKGRIPKIVDPSGSSLNPSYWAAKKSMMVRGKNDLLCFHPSKGNIRSCFDKRNSNAVSRARISFVFFV